MDSWGGGRGVDAGGRVSETAAAQRGGAACRAATDCGARWPRLSARPCSPQAQPAEQPAAAGAAAAQQAAARQAPAAPPHQLDPNLLARLQVGAEEDLPKRAAAELAAEPVLAGDQDVERHPGSAGCRRRRRCGARARAPAPGPARAAAASPLALRRRCAAASPPPPPLPPAGAPRCRRALGASGLPIRASLRPGGAERAR
jgi:hypothetical protein